MGDLDGSVAIVTGGGGNIGRGVCRALASAGASVAALDLDPSGADAAELQLTCDLTDEAARADAVDEVVRQLGGVDTLVNVAQAFRIGASVAELTLDDLDVSWQTGPVATIRMMQLCYPHLVARGGGAVVNFGSGAGTGGIPGHGAYATAKEAIRGISRVAANEWGPQQIRVNVICPVADSDPASASWATERVLAGIPLGRIGDPERDVGATVAFLAGPGGAYLTGMTLMVDGGGGRTR